MEKKIILLVQFISYIVAFWVRLMILTFTCAWGCRKQKINFLHLILSKTSSYWWCTFNILKFNFFFLIHIFRLIRLLYIILSLKCCLKYLYIYCSLLNIMPEELNKKLQLSNTSDFNFLSNNVKGLKSSKND